MKNMTIDIWEGLKYQGEMQDGFRPTLETYILGGSKQRGAVLICPGGGYGVLSDREAEPIAVQFNAAGFHAFVLNYSVAPRRHPQPLLDASRAMCILRENAQAWNLCPDQIAICGFSAGGHLAASLGVHWMKPYLISACGMKEGMNRPDAMVLCYPVISTVEFSHMGSFDNLLGEGADRELLNEMSLELHISQETPPAFIWHTFEDDAVPVQNSLLFAQGLCKANIPIELHVYQAGPHGLALATAETAVEGVAVVDPHAATWTDLCTEWLNRLFAQA